MTGPDSPEPATAGPASPQPAPATAHDHQVPPPANPFVPRYREPWVNPAKRTTALVVVIVAAVVLLAIGFVAGRAVGRHGFGPRGEMRVVLQHPGMYPGMYGRHGWPGYRPRGQFRQVPPAPSPTPSSSHS